MVPTYIAKCTKRSEYAVLALIGICTCKYKVLTTDSELQPIDSKYNEVFHREMHPTS